MIPAGNRETTSIGVLNEVSISSHNWEESAVALNIAKGPAAHPEVLYTLLFIYLGWHVADYVVEGGGLDHLHLGTRMEGADTRQVSRRKHCIGQQGITGSRPVLQPGTGKIRIVLAALGHELNYT